MTHEQAQEEITTEIYCAAERAFENVLDKNITQEEKKFMAGKVVNYALELFEKTIKK